MLGWKSGDGLRGLKTTLALLSLVLMVGRASGDEVVDQIMMRTPNFATPRVVRKYPDRLLDLWSQALQRPEVELRREAALAIIRARQLGMPGLEKTIPLLNKELSRDDQHATVLQAVSKALVELDSRESAEALHRLSAGGNADLAEVIEPALARWKYLPVREEWLKRLEQSTSFKRPAIRAIQCLGTSGEVKAITRLKSLALAPETSPNTRLEASRALGVLRQAGGEADAQALASDKSGAGLHSRVSAAWMLRHHSGEQAVKVLQSFSRDSESTVASVALTRLVEIDPALGEAELASHLKNADASIRSLGVEILFRRAKVEYLTLLGDRLSDLHPDVRSKARLSLKKLAGKFKSEVIVVGEKVLNGDDWRGKEQAAYLLTQLDHKPAADRLVVLLSDVRPETAIAAAWALRVLAVPSTYPKILSHLKTYSGETPKTEWRDRQLSQLVQLLGLAKYQPAHDTIKMLIPPGNPSSGFVQTRSAGSWAIGLLHEGQPNSEIAAILDSRINAVVPGDVEHELVRSMCIVSVARMKQIDKLASVRKFFYVKKPSFNIVSNACGWAIEQLTDEKMPEPGIEDATYLLWFLIPIG